MRLSELKIGQEGYITSVSGSSPFRKRIAEMGFIAGQRVAAKFSSPLGDPTTYQIMGYDLALRRGEAELINISIAPPQLRQSSSCRGGARCGGCCTHRGEGREVVKGQELNIAFIGNPNVGKTTLFNAISGGHERVGNYSGVTVSEKIGHIEHRGYKLNIIDLPGTYSLSALSPEERYVQYFLLDKLPDIVVNVVAASYLERNLYLTTQLMDLRLPMVVALNMYDELERGNISLDVEGLAAGVGAPVAPISAKTGRGITQLLDEVIDEYERTEPAYQHVSISFGNELDGQIKSLVEELRHDGLPPQFPKRYWMISMLQRNSEAASQLSKGAHYAKIKGRCEQVRTQLEELSGEGMENIIASSRYSFIAALLSKVMHSTAERRKSLDERIDNIVTHRVWGLPIFLLLMWLTFSATFTLGAYPQGWIDMGFGALSSLVDSLLPAGMLRDMVVDGIIAGVGGVAVFLPNIIILYLFIVVMEGSGYMARAAFIMDRIMRSVGLDGRSFIPYMMGFGCNVPAIMASRTIENRKVRLITILTNPFMSCSARLPVFILLAGAFFPHSAGTVITLLYIFGICMAIFTALILGRVIPALDDSPFILELPPYRFPSRTSILSQLWIKCERYIKRIGTLILFASIVIWVLDTFPMAVDGAEHHSYLRMLGEFVEPVMSPLGFDWRANVALFSGVAAKELIASTMGVLYEGGGEIGVEALAGAFTMPSAVAYMLFILLYFPCIGTVAAIAGECDKPKLWVAFSIIYNTALAWLVAYAGFWITTWIVG